MVIDLNGYQSLATITPYGIMEWLGINGIENEEQWAIIKHVRTILVQLRRNLFSSSLIPSAHQNLALQFPLLLERAKG